MWNWAKRCEKQRENKDFVKIKWNYQNVLYMCVILNRIYAFRQHDIWNEWKRKLCNVSISFTAYQKAHQIRTTKMLSDDVNTSEIKPSVNHITKTSK